MKKKVVRGSYFFCLMPKTNYSVEKFLLYTNDTSETTDSLFSTLFLAVAPTRLDDCKVVGTVVGRILVRNEARTFAVSIGFVSSTSGI